MRCSGDLRSQAVPLRKVISGGQTGVDQAALRAAGAAGLAVGGWCPPGRVCEAGVIPDEFPVTETPEDRSEAAPEVPRSQRTEWNVRDADATLILRPSGAPSGSVAADPGTEFTARCAERLGRPLLVCDPGELEAVGRVRGWLRAQEVAVLNVAGPSEGAVPGVGEAAFVLLWGVFASGAGRS
jgi:hypothetical protein